ncbi:extracellular solute-binding protein [Roseibium sp. MMSF_3412]|uniref:extracellular solute-binding protein n=1 Tax=Roseibium sp. MMSF_3412 TaxID=3046712 RepID=UPI00273FE4F4|nr:extracellular solute-binding protein [Roseibium sp. MMSF_3412]
MTFLGLTWDHPRGYDALAEAARQVNSGRASPLIHWEKQPLEGFESAPIAELAAGHDLLVLDHPHIGEAVAEGCLVPLEDLFSRETLEAWEKQSVGPSLASYRWQEKTWALPLDVATQVMVRRADRLAAPPVDWDAISDLAKTHPVAQSLAGPHAFLTLISMAAGEGAWAKGDMLLPGEIAEAQLEVMQKLFELRPRGSETLNPIALSETMSATEDVILVPLIFGYVTYAQSRPGGAPLAFSDTLRKPDGAGGVLGGTGIGFTRRRAPDRALLAHIAWLMKPDTQSGMIPNFGGQPSARSAWQDPAVDAAWGAFYSGTLATAENALLRPRFDGYIAFQTKAAEIIRQALADRQDPSNTLNALRQVWRAARAGARGDLDDRRGPHR